MAAGKSDAGKKTSGYFYESKLLSTGFLFALPLLLAYEVGILATGSDVANGAGVLLRLLVSFFADVAGARQWHMAVFNGLVVLAVFAAVIKTHDRGQPIWRPKLYAGMGCESLLYCLGLLLLMGWIPSLMQGVSSFAPAIQAAAERGVSAAAPAADPMADPVLGTVLSLGAGVYEEIFFRLFMLGGTVWLLTSGFGVEKGGAETAALLTSAILFSVFHHLGAMGDPWSWTVVIVRTVAGVFLGAIYLQRGLGIAIWAHALYDVVIVALRSTAG